MYLTYAYFSLPYNNTFMLKNNNAVIIWHTFS